MRSVFLFLKDHLLSGEIRSEFRLGGRAGLSPLKTYHWQTRGSGKSKPDGEEERRVSTTRTVLEREDEEEKRASFTLKLAARLWRVCSGIRAREAAKPLRTPPAKAARLMALQEGGGFSPLGAPTVGCRLYLPTSARGRSRPRVPGRQAVASLFSRPSVRCRSGRSAASSVSQFSRRPPSVVYRQSHLRDLPFLYRLARLPP